MNANFKHPKVTRARSARFAAFSLVEILVAIALLSVIVLGLLMMFNQTQRAFRMSMNQTDILESGRIITDMLAREIEQMSPCKDPTIFNPGFEEKNFLIQLSPSFSPYVQNLPGSTLPRTNILQHFFFLSRQNQDWVGTGYVLIRDAGSELGTLYRFSATKRPPLSPPYGTNLSYGYFLLASSAATEAANNRPVTGLSRVAEGVVHFRVRPFGPTGQPIIPPIVGTNLVVQLPNGQYGVVNDTFWIVDPRGPDFHDLSAVYFVRDAVPAAVELELGVLEQNILNRYKSLEGNGAAQRNYLSNHVGNVHIFRQRIPIRNVDTSVYP